MAKPRTLTGRVAKRMYDAMLQAHPKINIADFEYACMLCAAQVSQQGLTPADLDSDQGTEALAAICAMLMKEHDRDLIHVTSAWRRVVISARWLHQKLYDYPNRSPRERYWTYSETTETAKSGGQIRIPVPVFGLAIDFDGKGVPVAIAEPEL